MGIIGFIKKLFGIKPISEGESLRREMRLRDLVEAKEYAKSIETEAKEYAEYLNSLR